MRIGNELQNFLKNERKMGCALNFAFFFALLLSFDLNLIKLWIRYCHHLGIAQLSPHRRDQINRLTQQQQKNCSCPTVFWSLSSGFVLFFCPFWKSKQTGGKKINKAILAFDKLQLTLGCTQKKRTNTRCHAVCIENCCDATDLMTTLYDEMWRAFLRSLCTLAPSQRAVIHIRHIGHIIIANAKKTQRKKQTNGHFGRA